VKTNHDKHALEYDDSQNDEGFASRGRELAVNELQEVAESDATMGHPVSGILQAWTDFGADTAFMDWSSHHWNTGVVYIPKRTGAEEEDVPPCCVCGFCDPSNIPYCHGLHTLDAVPTKESSPNQLPYLHHFQPQSLQPPYTRDRQSSSFQNQLHQLPENYLPQQHHQQYQLTQSNEASVYPTPLQYPALLWRRPFPGLHQSYRRVERCTYAGCGKLVTDLKAHMRNHQNERPEKCPVQACKYNAKGFAKKNDKNKHIRTHYKGIIVCGFCPDSGSVGKPFDRLDVFKKHLSDVHATPNSQKKTSGRYAPDTSSKCPICSSMYDAPSLSHHLYSCFLRSFGFE
jgi:hypothetical protein